MKSKGRFRLVFSAISLVVAGTILFSSCTLENVFSDYPTVTPSPTPRECPPDTTLPSGNQLESTPTLFIIIFDSNAISAEKDPGLEYINGDKSFDILEFINNVIPSFAGPADQYVLFEFGYKEYADSRIGGIESSLPSSPPDMETPVPYITPTIYPTLNPTALATMDSLSRQEQIKTYNRNSAAQEQEIDQGLFEQDCRENDYKNSVDATSTAWEVTKMAEVTQIAMDIQSAEMTKQAQIVIRSTPLPYEEVYIGLRHTATDFQFLCKNYERCILIIFDQFEDWRNPSALTEIPDDIDYRLDKVDVIAVIPDCAVIQDPSCQDRVSRWDTKFKDLGALSAQYFDGQHLEKKLKECILKLKDKDRRLEWANNCTI